MSIKINGRVFYAALNAFKSCMKKFFLLNSVGLFFIVIAKVVDHIVPGIGFQKTGTYLGLLSKKNVNMKRKFVGSNYGIAIQSTTIRHIVLRLYLIGNIKILVTIYLVFFFKIGCII